MSDPASQTNDKIQKAAFHDGKKEKIGHRRVNIEGTVTYKKKTTSEIQSAIQLGVNLSVGSINNKPKRDLLLKDFGVEEVIAVPKCGTMKTPAHQMNDFQLRTFAPLAFRCFREIFSVDMCAFMDSICSKELKELSNPGASGSIFYLTEDDEFIIKTVQKKEAKFLQKLLPEYYMNLMQHPRTLLPKFFGLFSYETMGKNIRFVIMNNLLPSVRLHEKYDLKGSSFKRFASGKEKDKPCPTFKDLDFKEKHPGGIILESETYDALMSTIQRDCMVLESFRIMDYSLLLAVLSVDQYRAERAVQNNSSAIGAMDTAVTVIPEETAEEIENNAEPGNGDVVQASRPSKPNISHTRSVKRIAAFTTPMESIKPAGAGMTGEEDRDYDELPPGGIPARNEKGEKLYLYLGIIDILQSYQINKKLEHSFKAFIYDGDKISVTKPSFYKARFEEMFSSTVFKKAACMRPKRRPSRAPQEPESSLGPQRSKSEIHYNPEQKRLLAADLSPDTERTPSKRDSEPDNAKTASRVTFGNCDMEDSGVTERRRVVSHVLVKVPASSVSPSHSFDSFNSSVSDVNTL